MKTIGLIGGMSWQSTAEYYRLINEGVAARLGALHSAPCILYSVDFAPIERLQSAGEWDEIARVIVGAAQSLERAGADFFLLCTNTTHKIAETVEAAVGIPLVHIADAAGEAIAARQVRTVGLLGSRYTMEQDFYPARLAERFGIEVLVPGPADRRRVHEVIYQELCRGTIAARSREQFRRIIGELTARGAQGVILGCTEIPLLVRPEDAPAPLFDTTRLHAEKAVALALEA